MGAKQSRGARLPQPVAVIDIGSNSGRAVVYRPDAAGQLQILAATRAALRLVRDVDADRRLSEAAILRTLLALRDFRAIAKGAGARRIAAVATAAMRDAANGPELIARVRRELGIRIRIIDGDTEARYGFLGAIHGLPVEDGALFDLGGGSVQISRFRARRLLDDWSLPLGALRLSGRFLESDPPRREEMRRLQDHVRRRLERAGVPRLRDDEELVGTGGTVRNLAKLDRAGRDYPVLRLHGYVLSQKRIGEIARELAARTVARRERLPGLSDERADSIVGGALAIEVLLEHLGAARVLVSGQGVREGLAHSLLADALPSPRAVREASLLSFASRFATWDAAAAARRRGVAEALRRHLAPRAPADLRDALAHAAMLLDVGRSMDFFDRHEHVAAIVLETELNGFSHRDIALLAAVTLAARRAPDGRGFAPLLDGDDREAVARAGLILALADDIVERCPPGARIVVRCREAGGATHVSVPQMLAWRPRDVGPRFERLFGRELIVRPGRAR
jgi:exopolyphosphatase / guanosine-5'-triphosphate,3'-diphosphate pyrophosphatase